jgi:hypothetical protein
VIIIILEKKKGFISGTRTVVDQRKSGCKNTLRSGTSQEQS